MHDEWPAWYRSREQTVYEDEGGPMVRVADAPGAAPTGGYSPITLQIRPIMMKNPLNMPIRAMPP